MSEQSTTTERVHPLHQFTGRLHERLDQIGSPAWWSMNTTELTDTIRELATGISRLQGLMLSAIAAADRTDLAKDTGETNTAGLVRTLTRAAGPEARRTVRLATDLEDHPLVRDALHHGTVSVEQVREIVTAVEALPPSTGTTARVEAELHLLQAAREHDHRELRVLGKRLVEVVDPDHADEILDAQLRREEAKAARKSFLEFFDRGDGTSDYRGNMTTLHRTMLERLLAALTNPHRPDPIDLTSQTRAEARGQAFGQLLERIPADWVPTTGGVNASVVVTMQLETLTGGLQAAHLDTGQAISASQARRLACEAGIIPAVLGSQSEVLDLGRKVRLHSKAQRLAMNLQQHGTCAVEGCDRPAWLCDGAHLTAWQDGGHTNTTDGSLICTRHHPLVDSGRYHIQRIGPGRIKLIRRQ